ncbi:conjugal transfer protein TraC [Candidatus Kuenenbacteria bacterium CG11_big_fil_rev_8_21_14_0_20_37_9]|uniref:Conjugal transfer protein TraC n=1 Tax=Candidatus Kuenenbacteria bacterium CG08_land_8_20_14_0_20_37_23 TaxID=1974617 RepID=A0A2M6XTE6_9BACT|nr:MAG: conjugal transfer protein TraC [Candidatus Kuenenbacteria bacterium CG11_big_fil_rev_8_21_14_0_20_37_9]PIU10915.1 MAG: conjugal transfer protein TraC [Candidatus Kuenenbacteria bacterium CG08_land_8_20_14_0_20_37_23]
MFNPAEIEKQTKQKIYAGQGIKNGFVSEETIIEQEKDVLEAEKAYYRGVIRLKDLIAPAAMRVESSFLQLDDKFVATIFVTTYPRYISVGWFDELIDSSFTMDIAMYFFPIPSGIVLKQLKKKIGTVGAQIMADKEKGAPRDPLQETAYQDIEKLRDDLTQGIEHFFQFGLYLTIYSDSQKKLEEALEWTESTIAAKLVYTRRSMWQMEQGFNSTLPLSHDELAVYSNLNTSPIASTFPFVSSELTSDDGILYGINRHNNSLILFDRFSLQNANTVVFATSGAGKSYAIKLEILRTMMQGTDVIVIDPEREYQHLAEAVGGTYISISLNADSKINPFDLPKKLMTGDKAGDIIRSAVITVKGLVRLMIGEINHEEDSLLDKALLEVYAKNDITPESDLSQVNVPTLSDLEQVLEGLEGGHAMANRLGKYTKGTFGGLLNDKTNINIENQLVVFSVRDLEDELRPIAIYTVINYIWNIVRSELKKRILVVDEAWWLMQYEDSAKFIFALAKRCRKYYLGLTTITQDVNDFLISPYGKAIVTNSAIQILLRQSTAAIEIVANTFMLTQGERYLLLESGVGEGIFFAGSKHVAIKVIASYVEDQIITSDPRQLLEIDEAKNEFEREQEVRR